MPDLFNAVDKISDDELRREIAVLRCVSLSNAAAETGKRMIGKLAEFANYLVNPNNNEKAARIDYRVVTIVDMVSEQAAQLEGMSRAELNERFKNELNAKCRELNADVVPESMERETLSVWLIREAAKVFSIGENISPANMAVMVTDKYNQSLLEKLHKMLMSQSSDEIKKTDREIQNALNRVPVEAMREMARKVNPTEFSGAGIGRAIRRESKTVKLEAVVAAMGFEPFGTISVRAATVFDQMISFNRIARVLIADLVWLAIKAYGRKFTFAKDLLPSFMQGTRLEAADEEEKKYWININRRRDFVKRIEEQSKEADKINDKFSKAQARYMELLEEKKAADDAWKELESKKSEYTKADTKKTKDEIKRYFADVTKTSIQRDRAQESLTRAETQMDALGNQLMRKRELISQMNAEFVKLRSETDAMIAKKSRELALQWKAYFFRFTFDEIVFSTAVTEFTRSELLKLEEYMKEIHDSRRTAAYSLWTEEEEQDGNIVKYNGIKCLVSQGRDAKMLYSGTYIRKIS